MSVLATIRKKSSIFGSIALGAILLGFILSSGVLNLSSVIFKVYKKGVITLCGKKIDQEKYNLYKNFFRKRYSHAEYSESEIKKIVSEKLIVDEISAYEIEQLGIVLSKPEIVDIVQGDHISESLRSIKIFKDSYGYFRKQKLIDYLQNIHKTSHQEQQNWQNIEKAIIEERKMEKLENIFLYACNETSLEKNLNEEFSIHRKVVEYVFIPNEQIESLCNTVVSDENLHAYYENNIDEFTEGESYLYKYMNLSYQVTEVDVQEFFRDVEEVISELSEGDSLETFAKANSDIEESPLVDLSKEEIDILEQNGYTRQGDILKPALGGNLCAGSSVIIYKVIGKSSNGGYSAVKITKIFRPTYEMKNKLEQSMDNIRKKSYSAKKFSSYGKYMGSEVKEIRVREEKINKVSKALEVNFRDILDYTKRTSTKKILDPICLGNRGYLLLAYVGREAPKIKSFEEVKDLILKRVKLKKIKEEIANAHRGSTLAEFLEKTKINVEIKNAMVNFFENRELSDGFAGGVFGTKDNDLGVVLDEEGLYVFNVKEKNIVKNEIHNNTKLYREKLEGALVDLAEVHYK